MATSVLRTAARRGHLVSALGSQPLSFPFLMASRGFAVGAGTQLDLGAATSLQKARSWDEGVESGFATSSLADVFKGKKVLIFGLPGAYTGVCSKAHVPSYLDKVDAIKAKGVDSLICTAVNDPYTLHAWAQKLGADKIEFMADFDGSFHKLLGLDMDLSAALLGPRSQRWAAVVEDGTIKALEVEKAPSDMELTSADNMLKHL